MKHPRPDRGVPVRRSPLAPSCRSRIALVLAWLAVAAPLAWGVYNTIEKAAILFRY